VQKVFLIKDILAAQLKSLRAIFILTALLVSTSCKESASANAAAKRPPVPVTVATVVQRTIPIQVRTIGNVEAYSTINVKALIAGELTKVHFTEGDFVTKGQLLFEIDRRPYDEALHQAEANLARDAANLASAEAEARRFGVLVQHGAVALQDNDAKQAVARALDATVAADRSAIENAKLNLIYCSVHSPIDGRTGNLMVKEGNIIKSNDIPLVVINQVNPIYVTFAVPEAEFPAIHDRMRAGLVVEATPTGDDHGPANGKLTFADNSVDASTGTIKLKGTFDNPAQRLWPGQFVNVVLTVRNQPNAIIVPSQAVQTSQKGQFVYVVRGNKVEMRTVVIGRNVGNDIALDSGVQPGEVVVTDGQSRLVPNAEVQIVKTPVAGGAGQ
jgi:multidrug efflux system membrane fusion protein